MSEAQIIYHKSSSWEKNMFFILLVNENQMTTAGIIALM